MKKTFPYAASSLFLCLFFVAACTEIDYVQPFRWGKLNEVYRPLKGNIKEFADTSLDLIYLVQSGEVFTDEASRKYVQNITAYSNGYLQEIRRPLTDRLFVTYKINEMREFEEVIVTINGVSYAGFVSYPQQRSYKIRSLSSKGVLIDVIQETFNEDYSIQTRTIWDDQTQIATTEIYGSLTPPDGNEILTTQIREIIITDALAARDTLQYDQSGNFVAIKRVEQKTNSLKITRYLYQDKDSNDNYTLFDTYDLQTPSKRFIRTITYY